MDECIFLKRESEIVEDEQDPTIEIHYPLFECLIIKEQLGKCPFPARQCFYKDYHEDPSINGAGIEFKDGSILESLP